jgi:hypothetical protein
MDAGSAKALDPWSALPRSGPALPLAAPVELGSLPSPQTALAALAHGASISQQEGYRAGSDYCPVLPCGRVDGIDGSLVFTPDSLGGASAFDGLAFACYDFHLSAYSIEAAGYLRLSWGANEPNACGYYVALADFQQRRWQWFKLADIEKLNFGPLGPFVSPDGRLLLVLAVQGSASAGLEHLQLSANNQPTARLEFIDDNTPGVGGFAKFLDASASDDGGDPGDSIVSYEWDFKGDGNFELATEEALVEYGMLVPGLHQPVVRVCDEAGNTATALLSELVPGPPHAVLKARPPDPAVGEQIVLDASESHDPFGAELSYEWDLDGDGDFEIDTAALPQLSTAFPSQGSLIITVRITGNQGLQCTAGCTVTIHPTPLARFSLYPPVAQPGQPVGFDASLSSAWHGSLAGYEWDFDGDGNYEVDAGLQNFWNHSFSSTGYKNVGLRVTNAAGQTDVLVQSVAIEVGGGITVDSQGETGWHSSMALVEGLPAIAYQNAADGELLFIRALDTLGNTWGSPRVVDGFGRSGLWPSLEIINGKPAIAYCREESYDLVYVRAVDSLGEGWGLPLTLDQSGGERPCLAQVDGNPAISYGNGALRYIRALDNAGMLWSFSVQPDIQAQTGSCSSLSVVQGHPAIAYFCSQPGSLRYVRAANSFGSSWGSPQVLDSGSLVGLDPNLMVVNGAPALSYFDLGSGELRFIRSLDTSGSVWDSAQVLCADCGGLGSSLALIGGRACISYYSSGGTGDLRCLRALDASALSWDNLLLDSRGERGRYSSLLDLQGQAAVSYHDSAEGDLRFMRFAP